MKGLLAAVFNVFKYLFTLGALKWPGTNVDLIEMFLQPAFPCKYLKIRAQVFKTSSLKVSISRFTIVFESSKYMFLLLWNHHIKIEKNFIVTLSHWSQLKDFPGFSLFFAFFFPLISNSRESLNLYARLLAKTNFTFPNLIAEQSRRYIVCFLCEGQGCITSLCCHLATTQSTTIFNWK